MPLTYLNAASIIATEKRPLGATVGQEGKRTLVEEKSCVACRARIDDKIEFCREPGINGWRPRCELCASCVIGDLDRVTPNNHDLELPIDREQAGMATIKSGRYFWR